MSPIFFALLVQPEKVYVRGDNGFCIQCVGKWVKESRTSSSVSLSRFEGQIVADKCKYVYVPGIVGRSELSGTLHGATVCGETWILFDTFFCKNSEVTLCDIWG